MTETAFFGRGWLLLNHVNNVYICRELMRGMDHSDTPALLEASKRVCEKIRKRLNSTAHAPPALTAEEHRSLQQLLQTLKPEPSAQHGLPTKAGQAAVAALLDAVYGPGAVSADTLLDAVASGPLHKAEVLAQAAAAVLKRCLRASNCFTLMALARGAGCQQLAEAALLFALPNFSRCLQLDAAGLCALDDACLLQLLRNRHLQASSRAEALDAVVLWVKAAPAIRTRLLPSLLESPADLEQVETQLRAPQSAPLQQAQAEEGIAECTAVAAPEAWASRRCTLTRQDSRTALLAH